MNYKDIAVRAGKTFIQAAVAYAAVNFALVQDKDGYKTFLTGLVAAGVSAVWNTIVLVKNK